jgi:hypothetical protein
MPRTPLSRISAMVIFLEQAAGWGDALPQPV